MKIDFVLPWVDPSDTEWQKQKNAHVNSSVDMIANADARYRDMETLRYVLRSIEKNCPWFNKIYIITAGHYPEWLNLDSDRISLVTHDQIYFDNEHLPTFSSSSIEMNVLNIPHLSEYFVYLNDDTLIMRPTEVTRFFVDSKPVDFFVTSAIQEVIFPFKKAQLDTWEQSLRNSLKLPLTIFNVNKLDNQQLFHQSYSTREKLKNFIACKMAKKLTHLKVWHHPQAYKKSTLMLTYNNFATEMMASSASKFRQSTDLSAYFYRYTHLLAGDFYPYRHNDALKQCTFSSVSEFKSMISKTQNNAEIRFVCFNDTPSLLDEDYEKIKRELMTFLQRWFPEKASFEM